MGAQDTQKKLLETALELIWHSNYSAVGINEICKRAGVTKGSFYHHFDSKATLFCEATNYYWESVKKELDSLLSPSNSPLEQLENMINFIFSRKFGEDAESIPGCPFFSAGGQSGSGEDAIVENLMNLSQSGVKYYSTLVRNLAAADCLENKDVDAEQVARQLSQYIQGAISFARINHDIETAKKDLPECMYRLLGLKREYWFATKATWNAESCCLKEAG